MVLLGTPGIGKKSLAAALLRHMGEDGPSPEADDDTGVLSAAPTQLATVNNQRCRLVCDDIFAEEEEEETQETSSLIPKESARGGSHCCKLWRKLNVSAAQEGRGRC